MPGADAATVLPFRSATLSMPGLATMPSGSIALVDLEELRGGDAVGVPHDPGLDCRCGALHVARGDREVAVLLRDLLDRSRRGRSSRRCRPPWRGSAARSRSSRKCRSRPWCPAPGRMPRRTRRQRQSTALSCSSSEAPQRERRAEAISAQIAGMAQRITSRLRPDGEAVRLAADLDLVDRARRRSRCDRPRRRSGRTARDICRRR